MDEESWREAVLAVLLNLEPGELSSVTRTVAADSLFRLRRLSALLLCPSRFFSTLCYIDSLTLPHKATLLARLLLRSLRTIARALAADLAGLGGGVGDSRDYDAGLLLLTLCRMSEPERLQLRAASDWRIRVIRHVVEEAMGFSGVGFTQWGVVGPYVDAAMKCQRAIDVVGVESDQSPTAPAVFLSLRTPRGDGAGECVICREEVREEGRGDACELPCQHVFHWLCVVRWLKVVNTCPCCRSELPTDDVFREIRRLWRLIFSRRRRKMAGGLSYPHP